MSYNSAPSCSHEHNVSLTIPEDTVLNTSSGDVRYESGGPRSIKQHQPHQPRPIRGHSTPYKGYTVVKVEEKHGALHNAIPVMPIPLAVLCCIFNICAPGVGTLLSSFMVFCCGPTRIKSPCRAFGLNIVCGLLQMVTFVIIVGWIWSILWGMNFVQLALSKEYTMPSAVPYYVRRQSSLDT